MSDTNNRIKVGISSCLLGQEVRYDGGHKHSTLCTGQLAKYFDFVPTCPELGAGLGVPRPAIRLVGEPVAPRAVHVDDAAVDVTQQLHDFAARRMPQLADLCGYVFIKNSPSCGLFRVKVYRDNGYPHQEQGRGLFAAALTRAMPLLPVEEDGRLQDPVLRENFITRVFAWHNWQELEREGLSAKSLTDFHARYKYTLMAHSPQDYGVLGRLLADAGRHDPVVLGEQYFTRLMQALQQLATRKTHANVLMHLQGYLKKHLAPREKEHMGSVIEQYRKGILPLVVPVTLLRHHFHQHPDPYIERQAYLQPYPDDLRLRNQL
ncbi:MAG: YbgA family protein [Pseudohongiellaceae bacterium]